MSYPPQKGSRRECPVWCVMPVSPRARSEGGLFCAGLAAPRTLEGYPSADVPTQTDLHPGGCLAGPDPERRPVRLRDYEAKRVPALSSTGTDPSSGPWAACNRRRWRWQCAPLHCAGADHVVVVVVIIIILPSRQSLAVAGRLRPRMCLRAVGPAPRSLQQSRGWLSRRSGRRSCRRASGCT
jgi:hypothetical protein